MMNLENRRYLVTGAASGIGCQTAKFLHELGANLLLLDVNDEGLEKVAGELGSRTSILHYDLTNTTNQLYDLLIKDVQVNGKVNGFVHCAGLPYIAPVGQIKYDRAHHVFDVNTYAALELAKVTTKKNIRTSSNCASVLISSVYGLVGSAANAAYAMSKGAIIALTKALAMEYASKGIRFNCIAPGFVRTEMLEKGSNSFDATYVNTLESLHPLGLGNSRDIAGPIAFLLSDQARWITGVTIPVDGGFTAR